MGTITVLNDKYEVTDSEQRRFDELVEAGVYEVTAAQIATGDIEDINPEGSGGNAHQGS